MRGNLFTFFLMLVPFGVFSQVVISGNGQLLRYNAANIRVGGNWTNNATGVGYTGVAATGGVVFAGSSAQLINGTKVTTFQNLGISNTAGVSTVGIDVNVVALTFFDGIITISATFNMNIPDGGTMNPGKTTSFVNGTVAKTGNDAFIFEIGSGIKYAPLGITAPGSITDVFEADYILGAAPDQGNIPGNIELVSGFEYWDLQRTNGSSNVSVTLYWKNSQESEIGTDLTNLFIAHHDGVNAWDVATNGGTSGAGDLNSVQSGSITGGPYTSFGYFTFGSDNSTLTPLPIELINFEAYKNLTSIELFWTTASEVNNDYFILEKSVNAEEWSKLTLLAGQGNSTVSTDYSFIDKYPYVGNQYYRLKQVDFDGTSSYSKTILVNHEGPAEVTFDLYPNPLEGDYLQVLSPTLAEIDKIYLIDINGKVIEPKYQVINKGTYQIELDGLTGMYIVLINTENSQFREKIIKY